MIKGVTSEDKIRYFSWRKKIWCNNLEFSRLFTLKYSIKTFLIQIWRAMYDLFYQNVVDFLIYYRVLMNKLINSFRFTNIRRINCFQFYDLWLHVVMWQLLKYKKTTIIKNDILKSQFIRFIWKSFLKAY